MIGIVTWFNVPKGYGEIRSETNEVFFFTYLEIISVQKFKSIERGKVVEFQISDSRHFDLRTAKQIRHLTAVSKKKQDMAEQLRSMIA